MEKMPRKIAKKFFKKISKKVLTFAVGCVIIIKR